MTDELSSQAGNSITEAVMDAAGGLGLVHATRNASGGREPAPMLALRSVWDLMCLRRSWPATAASSATTTTRPAYNRVLAICPASSHGTEQRLRASDRHVLDTRAGFSM